MCDVILFRKPRPSLINSPSGRAVDIEPRDDAVLRPFQFSDRRGARISLRRPGGGANTFVLVLRESVRTRPRIAAAFSYISVVAPYRVVRDGRER